MTTNEKNQQNPFIDWPRCPKDKVMLVQAHPDVQAPHTQYYKCNRCDYTLEVNGDEMIESMTELPITNKDFIDNEVKKVGEMKTSILNSFLGAVYAPLASPLYPSQLDSFFLQMTINYRGELKDGIIEMIASPAGIEIIKKADFYLFVKKFCTITERLYLEGSLSSIKDVYRKQMIFFVDKNTNIPIGLIEHIL